MSDAPEVTEVTMKLVRPGDLADTLGVDAKLIRSFLRREFTRPLEAHNTAWHLNSDQVQAIRDHFIPPVEDEEEIADEA